MLHSQGIDCGCTKVAAYLMVICCISRMNHYYSPAFFAKFELQLLQIIKIKTLYQLQIDVLDIQEEAISQVDIFLFEIVQLVWRQIYSLMNLNLVQMETLKQRALDSKKYQFSEKPVPELQESLLITFRSTEYIQQQSSLSQQLGSKSIFIQTSSESFQLIRKDISSINYKINSFSSFYKTGVEKQSKMDSYIHIEKLVQMVRQTKNVYLIRCEYPEGYEISVTFVQALDCLSIAYGEQIKFIAINGLEETTSQDRSIIEQICYFWTSYCPKIKIQQVREYLKSHIIRGKLAFDFSQITWFQCCENTPQGYILAKDGLNKIQSLNMDKISKSRIQFMTNEDHLHRVVEDFSLSILASSPKLNQQFAGRCRIYFADSSNAVQVILNMNPFHLYLTEQIKQLIEASTIIERGTQHLKDIYQQLKKYLNHSMAYPFLYYQKIYQSINLFVRQIAIPKYLASLQFSEILRIVLYMNFKQISVKKYGQIFYLNLKLRKNILKINIDNYGPIGCKVITFFSFISCFQSMDPIKKAVKSIFQSANLHNETLDSISVFEQIITKQLNQDSTIHLFNFFLNKIPTHNQWRQFCRSYQQRQINDTFYRINYICQNTNSFFRLGDDCYPFSIETISDTFYKAYQLRRTERLLKERVQQLKTVVSYLYSIKNVVLAQEAKIIEINYDHQAVNSELVKRISTILKSQINEENVNNYYLLLSGLQKYKSQQSSRINETSLACLLSQIFFNVPTIKPQGWL